MATRGEIKINSKKNKSKVRAQEILKYTVDYLANKYDKILCLLLVGSLSNGSYIEGKGRDIDLITILKDNASPLIKIDIEKDYKDIEDKFNNDIPISRTIYFINEISRPFKTDFSLTLENKHLLEVPVELQRIHESGILLYGTDIISTLPVPTRNEYIFFDILAKEFIRITLENDPDLKKSHEEFQKNLPTNLLIQSILTNAFRHYFYTTGKTCCNKHLIYSKMKEYVPNYKYLEMLEIATLIKTNPDKNMPQIVIDKLKLDYTQMKKWEKINEVYEVPYINL